MHISISCKKPTVMKKQSKKASWETEWSGKIFCSHGTKHSKGVMILLNPKYDIDVIKYEKDNQARLIVLDTNMNGANLVLMNLSLQTTFLNRYSFSKRL